MLKVFRNIDDFVFDVPKVGVQALASYLQYYFDTKPMAIARFCLGLQIVVMLATVSIMYQRAPLNQFYLIGSLILLAIVLMSVQYFRTYKWEDVFGKMTRNYRRVDDMFLVGRMFQLALIVWGLPQHWISLLYTVPLAGYVYFSAADQLPPSERYQWRKPVMEGV